jgi:uncharacterized membrane protein YfcA
VNLGVAGLVSVGFFLRALAGVLVVVSLSNVLLERVFGRSLLLISIKMILAK